LLDRDHHDQDDDRLDQPDGDQGDEHGCDTAKQGSVIGMKEARNTKAVRPPEAGGAPGAG
jgi:hypothetical protein